MTRVFKAEDAYWSADLHLFHKAMLRGYTGLRPFDTVDEMHDRLIKNWNQTVPPLAAVFVLGDVSFGKPDETVGILGQLNGHLILINGNHDKKMKGAVKAMFSEIHDYLEVDVDEGGGTKQRIVMSHYAFRVWNRSHYGSWNLHGHSHGSLTPAGKQQDVGLDAQGMFPVSYWLLKLRMMYTPVAVVDHHRPKDTQGPKNDET